MPAGERFILIGKGKKVTFLAAVNVLYPHLDGGHTDVYIHKNPSSFTLAIYTL